VGQVELAPVFDLSWTSARVACEWYLVEGGRPFYMPEGFDASAFEPRAVSQDIPVSFIGAGYGYRIDVVDHLRGHGIDVRVFGNGWQGAQWADDVVDIINRSIINLGMGGIGYSETLTNVKARDFEVPGTGGGMYLTSFNADLAMHLSVGDEIVCYSNRDELVELTRYFLNHRDEARVIAQRGRARCLAEHRWLNRYVRVCVALGILDSAPAEHHRVGSNEALA
jgi:spore maturation protein CgeB